MITAIIFCTLSHLSGQKFGQKKTSITCLESKMIRSGPHCMEVHYKLERFSLIPRPFFEGSMRLECFELLKIIDSSYFLVDRIHYDRICLMINSLM